MHAQVRADDDAVNLRIGFNDESADSQNKIYYKLAVYALNGAPRVLVQPCNCSFRAHAAARVLLLVPRFLRVLRFALSPRAGTWLGFEDLTTQLDVCSGLPLSTKGVRPLYFRVGPSPPALQNRTPNFAPFSSRCRHFIRVSVLERTILLVPGFGAM